MKGLRIYLYAWLYKWALVRWRNLSGDVSPSRINHKVTDHAVLRYAMRIDGWNANSALTTLNSREVRKQIEEIGGTGKFALNGIVYTVEGGKILTVFKAEGAKRFLAFQGLHNQPNQAKSWRF